MNQNRIDKIGVAAVVDFFCRMGHIDPHIAFDDKIPVWDGSIDIHKAIDSNSKEDIEFCPIHLSESISSLDELDDAVYDKCDEHIEEVFDHCKYKIQLLDE